MAIVGENLLQPESGWQRIDDKNTNIIYNGTFSDGTGVEGTYNLTHHAIQPNDFTSNVEFYFYGTKLRIVGQTLNNRSKIINITIDDIHETYSNYVNAINGDATNCILQYEKLNLEKKIHKVTIQNDPSQTNTYVVFDAIDIDSDGYMIYRDETTNKLYYDMTPVMTSSNMNGNIVSASSVFSGGSYSAIYAFNGINTPSSGWASSSGSIANQWLQIQLKGKTKITACSITTTKGGSKEAPKEFIIQGCDDGASWKNLKTFNNITDWDSSVNFDTKIFSLDNIYNYKYYRLYMISTNGATGVFSISELRYLFEVKPFYLIEDNRTYYNYDTENNTLVEVDDTTILTVKDLENTCIYNLNNIIPHLDSLSEKFNLVSNIDNKITLNGLKQNKTLVIAKQSFSTKLARNIDFFELFSNISNTSSIKMAVSNDEGVTWKVYDNINNEFIDLIISCPLKEYLTLTQDELIQWNTFRDEVYLNGMNATILKTIDFNSIKAENMMFAYVFDRSSYIDKCEMSKLQYQFDAEGSYIALKDSEVDIKQNSQTISIIPKKDIELMKVNIGSSGEINIGNTEKIEEATDEDINNILGGDW